MSPLVSMNTTPPEAHMPRRSFLIFKRIADVFFSLMLCLLLLPLGLILALVSAINTKASPLFIQKRVGRNGKLFSCLKFRTMSKAAPANVATCDLNAKKYISRIGSLMRRSSLDELPQLWNILQGDMSFVGPRPIIPEEEDLHRLRRIHGAEAVRPGLTGWAQINGRDNLRASKKAFMDGYYAHHACLKLDLQILLKTVLYVVSSKDIADGREQLTDASEERTFRCRSAS